MEPYLRRIRRRVGVVPSPRGDSRPRWHVNRKRTYVVGYSHDYRSCRPHDTENAPVNLRRCRSGRNGYLEIVGGLRKACEASAIEYNAQVKVLSPAVVSSLGFPVEADCEDVEVDTFTP